VADLIRSAGSCFLSNEIASGSAGSTSSAVGHCACRTAALGGHIDQCTAAASCPLFRTTRALWGVFSNGGGTARKAYVHEATPSNSPLRLDLRRASSLSRRRNCPCEDLAARPLDSPLAVSLGSARNVDFRRGQITMPTTAKLSNVLCCLQHDHCAGMRMHVGETCLPRSVKAFSVRRFSVTAAGRTQLPID